MRDSEDLISDSAHFHNSRKEMAGTAEVKRHCYQLGAEPQSWHRLYILRRYPEGAAEHRISQTDRGTECQNGLEPSTVQYIIASMFFASCPCRRRRILEYVRWFLKTVGHRATSSHGRSCEGIFKFATEADIGNLETWYYHYQTKSTCKQIGHVIMQPNISHYSNLYGSMINYR